MKKNFDAIVIGSGQSGPSGCTPTSAGCHYSVRIWKARICSGLGFIGQVFKRLHSVAQSLGSVTQPVQILEARIFGNVLSTELKLV